jgi:TatD DNase family protein
MGWIDIHTHLNFLEITPEEAIAQAQADGVERMITIGTEPQDHQIVLDIARRHYPVVCCTLGVHPHEATLYTDEVEKFIDSHAPDKEVAAIGEIGLDYYYNKSPVDIQIEAFRRQAHLALKHKMPVEIHTRDAEADTAAILEELNGELRGVLHCFTGTRWLAEKALDQGLDISISGVVTFKKADELRDVVKFIPLDRLHVETDAPFLAPIPFRGRKNVPAFVVHTAKVVAELKGITEAELLRQTQINARRTFPKVIWPS